MSHRDSTRSISSFLDSRTSDVRKRDERIEELQQELEKSKSNVEFYKTRAGEMEALLQRKEATANALASDLSTVKSQKQKLDEDIKQATARAAQAEANAAKMQKEFEQQLRHQKTSLATLQKEKDTVSNDLKATRTRAEKAESDATAAKKRVAELEQQLKNSVDALQKEKEVINNDLKATKTRAQSSEADAATAKKRVTELEQQLQQLKTSLDALQKEKDAVIKELNATKVRAESAETEVSSKKQVLAAAEEETKQAQQRVTELQQRIKELQEPSLSNVLDKAKEYLKLLDPERITSQQQKVNDIAVGMEKLAKEAASAGRSMSQGNGKLLRNKYTQNLSERIQALQQLQSILELNIEAVKSAGLRELQQTLKAKLKQLDKDAIDVSEKMAQTQHDLSRSQNDQEDHHKKRKYVKHLLEMHANTLKAKGDLKIKITGLEMSYKMAKAKGDSNAATAARESQHQEKQELLKYKRNLEKYDKDIFEATAGTGMVNLRLKLLQLRAQLHNLEKVEDAAPQKENASEQNQNEVAGVVKEKAKTLEQLRVALLESSPLFVKRSEKHYDDIQDKTKNIYLDSNNKYNVVLRKLKGTPDNKLVVLKKLGWTSDKHEQVSSEIKMLCELNHPNIIKVNSVYVVEKDRLVWIEMEHCTGGEVSIWSQNRSFRERKRAVRQLLQAIAYLHSRQVIHRDIKPSNIVFDEKNQCKLIDIGVSKAVSAQLAWLTLSTTYDQKILEEKIRGTLFFIDPELRNGKCSASFNTDMWSTGMVAATLLLGVEPPCDIKDMPTTDDVSFLKEPIQKIIYDSDVTEEEKVAAIDLVKQMLASKDRASAKDAANHRFFTEFGPLDEQNHVCGMCFIRLADRQLQDCKHMLCQKCLQDEKDERRIGTKINCPFCKKTSVIGSETVVAIRCNPKVEVVAAAPNLWSVEDGPEPPRTPEKQGKIRWQVESCTKALLGLESSPNRYDPNSQHYQQDKYKK